jgi:hypothetical protein
MADDPDPFIELFNDPTKRMQKTGRKTRTVIHGRTQIQLRLKIEMIEQIEKIAERDRFRGFNLLVEHLLMRGIKSYER